MFQIAEPRILFHCNRVLGCDQGEAEHRGNQRPKPRQAMLVSKAIQEYHSSMYLE